MVKIKNEPSLVVSQPSTVEVQLEKQANSLQEVQKQDEFLKATGTSQIKKAPLIKPVSFRRKTKSEYKYLTAALEHRRPSDLLTPKTKSLTYSFNHTHEYAIEDGFLWYKEKGAQTWKPLYFDGFKKGRTPISVSADGANLVVVDDRNQVHYRKVLKEYRAEEIDFDNDEDCRASRERIQGCPYVALDLHEISTWEKKWFSLPVLNLVVNAFRGRHLTIPDDALGFTISHRGRYNDYVEDKLGQHHPVGTGVTTGYILAHNGQDIPKKDPWSPPGAKTTIYLPETPDSVFVAQQIASSASTVAALGYETILSTGDQEMNILTRLADIDTDGGDPFLKYDYFKDENNPGRRILPTDDAWQKHPLRLHGDAFVTKSLTIAQTGAGNKARVLTIDGTNAKGEWGFYRKNLQDPNWEFMRTNIEPLNPEPVKPSKRRPTTSTVHNYVGTVDGRVASMDNFGLRSPHSKIRLKIGERNHYLDLYRRFSFANFLGINSDRYDLVIPTDHADLKQLFGEEKVISVRVSEKKGHVSIRSPVLTRHPFKFAFERVDA